MHDYETELRTLRERLEQLEEQLDQIVIPSQPLEPILVKTTTITTYPTAPSVFVACIPQRPTGDESEGSAIAVGDVGDGSGRMFVGNFSGSLPASGTKMLALPVGGRYVFAPLMSVYVAKTSSAVAAASGATTPGSATVTLYSTFDGTTLSGTSTVTCYNWTSSAIGGTNKNILVGQVYGNYYFAISESCGGSF